jgi:hypothetical protein
MMRLPRCVSSSALVFGSVFGLAMLSGGTADAGHAHFSGSVRIGGHFRGGVSVHVGRSFARPAIRPRVWVGGRWWYHGYYWPRPYFYYYYPYTYGPESYGGYGNSYYPVQPGAGGPGTVAMAAPRRREQPLPVFGIGVFGGGTAIHDQHEAKEFGALIRLRLSPSLLLEGELAKDTLDGDTAAPHCTQLGPCPLVAVNGQRVDRRIGGSLIWELGARNMLAPYLLVGGGVQQAKVSNGDFFNSDFSTTQDFGEVGVGLRLALSRTVHIAADIRAGRRKTIDSSDQGGSVTFRTIDPPSGGSNNDTEDYTRARVAAILNF